MSDSTLSDLSKRILSLGLGVASLTKERAEEIVQEMIDKGEVKRGEARQFLSSAKSRGKELRGELQSVAEEQVDRAFRKLRLGVQADIRDLERRLRRVETRLDRLEKSGKPSKTSAAKKKKKTKKASSAKRKKTPESK